MNEHDSFAREVAAWITDEGAATAPDRALDQIITDTGRTRPLPGWLALIKEPPMRISTAVAVGSPVARVAAILAATLLLAVMTVGTVVAGAQLLAGSALITVAQDGSGDHGTITEAVEAASDGDSILVMPGIYTESIMIDKDITLSGEGEPGAVVIEFDAESPIVFVDPDADGDDPTFPVGLRLETSAAEISGLTVSGPEPGMAVLINGGSPTLEGLSIVLASLDEDDGDDYFDSRVSFQLMGGSTAVIRGSEWDGYFAVREGSAPTIDNVVTGNGIAIYVLRADPLIVGNELDGNDSGVVVLLGSPMLEDNTITGGTTGLDLSGLGTTPTLSGNVICDNETNLKFDEKTGMPDLTGNEICQDAPAPSE